MTNIKKKELDKIWKEIEEGKKVTLTRKEFLKNKLLRRKDERKRT